MAEKEVFFLVFFKYFLAKGKNGKNSFFNEIRI
jgi:hypothetical protein